MTSNHNENLEDETLDSPFIAKKPKSGSAPDFSSLFLSGMYPSLTDQLLSYLLPVDLCTLEKVNKSASLAVRDDKRGKSLLEYRRHLLNPSEYSLQAAQRMRLNETQGEFSRDDKIKIFFVGDQTEFFYLSHVKSYRGKLTLYRKRAADGIYEPKTVVESVGFEPETGNLENLYLIKNNSVIIALMKFEILAIKADSGEIVSRYEHQGVFNYNPFPFLMIRENDRDDDFFRLIHCHTDDRDDYDCRRIRTLTVKEWNFVQNRKKKIFKVRLDQKLLGIAGKGNYMVLNLFGFDNHRGHVNCYELQCYDVVRNTKMWRFSCLETTPRQNDMDIGIAGDCLVRFIDNRFVMIKLETGFEVFSANKNAPWNAYHMNDANCLHLISDSYNRQMQSGWQTMPEECQYLYFSGYGIKLAGIDRVPDAANVEIRDGCHCHPDGMRITLEDNQIEVNNFWLFNPDSPSTHRHSLDHLTEHEKLLQCGQNWFKINVRDLELTKLKWVKRSP